MSDTVLVALIAGGMPFLGTVVTVIVTAIGNRKALGAKVDRVEEKVDNHIKGEDRKDAIQTRARILRFRNDIRAGSSFDEDYWNAIMRDITNYQNYCKKDQDFPNEICLHAITFIENKYDELLASGGFAQD